MHKIVVLSTVHHYLDARINKEIFSLKKKFKDIFFIAQAEEQNEKDLGGVKFFPLPIPKTKKERFLNQRKAFALIKKIKPDILHFHDPELAPFAYLVKKKFKTKIVFDIHENIHASLLRNDWLPSALKPVTAKLYSVLENFLLNKFDGLIIAEKSYRKIYGSAAVELLNFPIIEGESKFNKEFHFPVVFVYSGMIWERRGIWQMLNLIKMLKENNFDIKFNLIGSFASENLKQSVLNFISENNLNEIVKIHGRKPIDETLKIINQSHVGLALLENIENYRESLSSKIFDYMSQGLPYLVSDFPIYDEYAVEANTGITVNYDDINEIFDKTVSLISNPEQMKTLGKNGFYKTRSEWNWESQENRLFELYDKILSKV